jgi:hypothetical protein
MSEITIYAKNGKITRWVNCPDEYHARQLLDDENYVLGHYSSDDFYIETEKHVPIEKGPQPTVHCLFNYLSKQWIDPRTLQDHKTAKWLEIKQTRSQAEYAGFTWDESVFDSDALSQQRITGAVTLAQMDAGFSIGWTLADNTVRHLSAAQMKEVGAALGVHVATQFAHAQDLRTQLDAAQTAEQVAALGW